MYILLCMHYGGGSDLVIQSCQTLCDPIAGSPPGFAIPGILQARVLEWAAISFSKEDSLPLSHQGSPRQD